MMATPVDLRAMVRDVLREALAAEGRGDVVAIRSDADFQAFVAHLAAPGVIEAVRAGTRRFRLASDAPAAGSAALEGVVSERRLVGLAGGTVVRLAAGAVLTPMARDAARRLGLKFERIGS